MTYITPSLILQQTLPYQIAKASYQIGSLLLGRVRNTAEIPVSAAEVLDIPEDLTPIGQALLRYFIEQDPPPYTNRFAIASGPPQLQPATPTALATIRMPPALSVLDGPVVTALTIGSFFLGGPAVTCLAIGSVLTQLDQQDPQNSKLLSILNGIVKLRQVVSQKKRAGISNLTQYITSLMPAQFQLAAPVQLQLPAAALPIPHLVNPALEVRANKELRTSLTTKLTKQTPLVVTALGVAGLSSFIPFIGIPLAWSIGLAGLGKSAYNIQTETRLPLKAVPTLEQLREAIRPSPVTVFTAQQTEEDLEGELKIKIHAYLRLYRRRIEITSIFGEEAPSDLLTNIASSNYEKEFEKAINNKLNKDNISSFLKPLYKGMIKIKRFCISYPLSYITSKIEKKLIGQMHLIKPGGAQKLMNLISKLAKGLITFSETLKNAYNISFDQASNSNKILTPVALKEKVTQMLSKDSSLRAGLKTSQEFSSAIINQVLRDVFDWSLSRIFWNKVISYLCPNLIETLTQQLPQDSANGINLQYTLFNLLHSIMIPLIITLKAPKNATRGPTPPAFAPHDVEILKETLEGTILAIQLANWKKTQEAKKILKKADETPSIISLDWENRSMAFINPEYALQEGANHGALLLLKSLEDVMLTRNELLKLASTGLDTLTHSFSRQAQSLPTDEDLERIKHQVRTAEKELIDTLIEQINKDPAYDAGKMHTIIKEFIASTAAQSVAFADDLTAELGNPFGIKPDTLETFLERITRLETQANKIIRDNGITDRSLLKVLKEPTDCLRLYLNDFAEQQNDQEQLKRLMDSFRKKLEEPMFKNPVFSTFYTAQVIAKKMLFNRAVQAANIPAKIDTLVNQIFTFIREPTTLRYLAQVPLAEYIRA